MALRVLLADESSTIKKVLQLALSDYGVEVKSVPSGIDVIPVAQDFGPDIIFADVLLTKRNGYEVCAEIKAHNKLKSTPVVLMWSSFMEFDEKLAQKSGADGRLEKPFDTEALRAVVEKLVKKTSSHPLKGLLSFPTLPDFEEPEKESNNNNTGTVFQIDDTSSDFEDFQPLNLKKNSPPTPPTPVTPDFVPAKKSTPPQQSPMQKADPTEDIHLETENYGEFEEVVLVKSDKSDDLEDQIQGQLKTYLENSPVALNKVQQGQDKPKNLTRFEEQLMREEVRLMAEKICWQIIPEITEKIVREELKKLLTDIEKSV